jgi:pyruvate dehydrogenase E2 component (dihydrolipoamide acetyltransferase)
MSDESRRRIDVIVPQVGEAIAEATLVRWLKHEGDQVKRGDVLFEVDLDKSTVEVEAFEDGVLASIQVPDDSPVLPLQKVAELLVEGRQGTPAPAAEVGQSAPRPTPATTVAARPADGAVSPRARRRAHELGVDLANVVPSAAEGVISVADVERAAAGPAPATGEPLTKVRAAVAERMAMSKRTVPHFYLLADVDMAAVVAARSMQADQARRPTVTAFLVAAAAAALATNPEFNASFADGTLVRREQVSVGVAVDTPEGLRVAVIPHADRLTLADLDTQLREAAQRARSGRLRSSDVGTRSMVVSNLGMHGVDAFVAIIDEPDPFILAAGRIRDAVVVVDGAPAVRPVATLSLSVDHRAFDGVQAARFLAAITTFLAALPEDAT